MVTGPTETLEVVVVVSADVVVDTGVEVDDVLVEVLSPSGSCQQRLLALVYADHLPPQIRLQGTQPLGDEPKLMITESPARQNEAPGRTRGDPIVQKNFEGPPLGEPAFSKGM